MRCAGVRNRIMTYVDGRLSEVEEERFESHLAVCPLCRRYYADEVEMAAAFRTNVKGMAGAGFVEGVLDRLGDADLEVAPSPRLPKLPARVRVIAAAALLLVAIAIGLASPRSGTPALHEQVVAEATRASDSARDVLGNTSVLLHRWNDVGFHSASETLASVRAGAAENSSLILTATVVAALLCAGLVWRFRRTLSQEVLES